jgi:hypothetical protein
VVVFILSALKYEIPADGSRWLEEMPLLRKSEQTFGDTYLSWVGITKESLLSSILANS